MLCVNPSEKQIIKHYTCLLRHLCVLSVKNAGRNNYLAKPCGWKLQHNPAGSPGANTPRVVSGLALTHIPLEAHLVSLPSRGRESGLYVSASPLNPQFVPARLVSLELTVLGGQLCPFCGFRSLEHRGSAAPESSSQPVFMPTSVTDSASLSWFRPGAVHWAAQQLDTGSQRLQGQPLLPGTSGQNSLLPRHERSKTRGGLASSRHLLRMS